MLYYKHITLFILVLGPKNPLKAKRDPESVFFVK